MTKCIGLQPSRAIRGVAKGWFSGIVVEVRGRNQWFCGANRVKFGFFAALDCPMLPI